jgi:CheY-like chemotaxis protein
LRLLTGGAHGESLRFEVADTGPGIPAESRHDIFQDFARLDDVSASTVEGCGLGLSLSKQLAELMGGLVGHEVNPRGGSIFWLELPPLTGCDEAIPIPAPVSMLDLPPNPSAPTRSLKVLVVDDNATNRDVAAAFLRSGGHKVVCAEGGVEAIEAVVAADFDVVAMDVRMPGMDGLEATRRIRALKGVTGRVPIVAVTGQTFSDQVEQCRDAGMNGYLAKPFTPDSLLAAIAVADVGGPGVTYVGPPP